MTTLLRKYIYAGERNKRSNIMYRRRGRSACTYQLKRWPAADDWTITEIVKPIQITTICETCSLYYYTIIISITYIGTKPESELQVEVGFPVEPTDFHF